MFNTIKNESQLFKQDHISAIQYAENSEIEAREITLYASQYAKEHATR